MDIEIKELYVNEFDPERGILIGNLRVRIVELGIELLGCHVSKRGDRHYFSLPSRRGVNHETGQTVSYPLVSFVNRNLTDELLDAIKDQGRSFIEQWIVDRGNVPIERLSPRKEVKAPAASPGPKVSEKAAAPMPPTPEKKPKIFTDPPPRTLPARNTSKFSRK